MTTSIRGCVWGALRRLAADGLEVPPVGSPGRAQLVAEVEAAYLQVRVADPDRIAAAWRSRQPTLLDVLPD